MTVRWISTILLVALLPSAGCMRRTTVHDFGLTREVTKRAASAPGATVRAVFQQQTQGAFDPLIDDSRIRAAQSRLKANPADNGSRLELAALYEGYRFYDQALEQYTEAFARSRSETAILGIVRCNRALNRASEAIPLLEQYLQLTPSAAAWNMLGLLHASGNPAAGEQALREAVAADPQSDQWHNDLGYTLLLQDKTDAAESEFRKALELNPKSIRAHNNLGMLLARRGDVEGALEEFRFGADTATAHNNMAVVLMEMGKYEQSREQLVRALAIRRNFAPALSNFKLVQDRIKQRTELQKLGRLPQSNVRVASTAQEASQMKQQEEPR